MGMKKMLMASMMTAVLADQAMKDNGYTPPPEKKEGPVDPPKPSIHIPKGAIGFLFNKDGEILETAQGPNNVVKRDEYDSDDFTIIVARTEKKAIQKFNKRKNG